MGNLVKIKKIYPLSPMQNYILDYYINNRYSDAYFEQTIFTIKGELDLDLFKESFKKLIEKYDVLRTIFIYQNLNRPRQVVLNFRDSNIYFEDISYLPEGNIKKYEEDFKVRDREKKFDLSRDLLIRISILKTGTEKYRVLWSHHHILIDGWSLGIMMSRFMDIYMKLRAGEDVNLTADNYQYKDYIDWLQTKDRKIAFNYWQDYLSNYENQSSLLVKKQLTGDNYMIDDYCLNEYTFVINKSLTRSIKNTARRNKVTINTIFQTVWGLILCKYNETVDTVFASMTSGRKAEINGVEEIIGLFINIIFVRIKADKKAAFINVVKRIQEQMMESRRFDYLSFNDLQHKLGHKDGLINSVFKYQNYPIDRTMFGNSCDNERSGFSISDVKVFEQSNYDLVVSVGPGDELKIKAGYNALVFNRNQIVNMLEDMIKAVGRFIEKPDLRIKELII